MYRMVLWKLYGLPLYGVMDVEISNQMSNESVRWASSIDESEGKHSYHVKEMRAKVHGTDTCDYCVYDLGLCQASA